jgi:alkylation response protein AidB-like acyl-CoA dehydrogenase
MTMTTSSAALVAGNHELDELAATIRAFCRKRLPDPTLARPGAIRDAAAAREHWGQLATEIGPGSLLVPEEFGGAGTTLVEAGRVAEALSAELAAVPFLSSGVLAPTLLTPLVEGGATPVAGEVLASLASGERVAAVAWSAGDPSVPVAEPVLDARAEAATGRFCYVIDADVADWVLLVGARGKQVALVHAADLRITPRAAFDLTRGIADVVAEGAPVVASWTGSSAATAFRQMLAAGRLALAAECAGGAQAALAQAVDYAKTRIQFGREIGSFQAIKHILADCYVAAESALSGARLAIAAHVAEASDADELRVLAAFYCADRFAEVAAADIQVHGGIGFTAECSAHLYRRRAEADRHLLGEPAGLRADYLTTLITKAAHA